MEETITSTSIVAHFDEAGHIEIATKLDGTPLQYHENETKHIHKSNTRLATNGYHWKFKNVSIIINFDEQGNIISATKLDRSPLVYDSSETLHIPNTGARLRTPNDCCWLYVGGWRCKPEYC